MRCFSGAAGWRAMSRRDALALLCHAAGGAAIGIAGAGCSSGEETARVEPWKPPRDRSLDPPPTSEAYSDNVDALFDLLIPAERDEAGAVVSPGAREAGASDVLRLENFVPIAVAQGLLPPIPESVVDALGDFNGGFRASLNAHLDALSFVEQPLTPFRDLPRELQETVIDAAFDDAAQRPALLVVRAACFAAFLGGITTDVGLRTIGFPPFENLAEGIAVSGYPRTTAGRLVDAQTEDLAALAAAGELDDYTYNREPEKTPGDDLDSILDENGDLF